MIKPEKPGSGFFLWDVVRACAYQLGGSNIVRCPEHFQQTTHCLEVYSPSSQFLDLAKGVIHLFHGILHPMPFLLLLCHAQRTRPSTGIVHHGPFHQLPLSSVQISLHIFDVRVCLLCQFHQRLDDGCFKKSRRVQSLPTLGTLSSS